MFFPSRKVIAFRLGESFHPLVLYSTERQCFLNFGKPFLPDTFFLQLSKKRAIALQVRSAAACLAIELSSSAKGNSAASTAQYLLRSYLPMPLLSIQKRKHLFWMNWLVRIASSIALYCSSFPFTLNS